MRRFEQRPNETLVLAELLDRTRHRATTAEGDYEATVEDVAIERERSRDWASPRCSCRKGTAASALGPFRRRRGETVLVAGRGRHRLHAVHAGAGRGEPARDLRGPASPPTSPRSSTTCRPSAAPRWPRRWTTRSSPTSSRSCPRTTRSRSSATLDSRARRRRARGDGARRRRRPAGRAVTAEKQEELLQLMEPDEAADLRRLLTYDEKTAGGMMTTEPVILGPEATIAEALAVVRRVGARRPRSPSTVYVCRAAAGDARPAGSSASCTSSGCCASRRTRRSAASSTRSIEPLPAGRPARPGHPAARDLQPGRACPVVDARRPPARRGHRRRRPRPHAPRGLARGPARGDPMADARPPAVATARPPRPARARPAGAASLPRAARHRQETFGRWTERFARFMGTAAVPHRA